LKYSIFACDIFNNCKETSERSVKLNPYINFLSPPTPPSDKWVNKGSIVIAIPFLPEKAEILRKTWLRWQSLGEMSCEKSSQNHYECFLNISQIDEGEYTIKAKAKAGGYVESAERSLKIDKSSPKTKLSAKIGNKNYNFKWTNKDVKIKLECEDEKSGCANTTYGIKEGGGGCYRPSELYTGEFTVEKHVSISYHSVDKAENWESWSGNCKEIKIDKKVPSIDVSVNIEKKENKAQALINISAFDEESGIDNVELLCNNKKERLEREGNFYIARKDLERGKTYDCTITVQDNAGNIKKESIQVGVEAEPPITTINATTDGIPYNQEWTNKNVIVRLKCEDDSGCKVTKYCFTRSEISGAICTEFRDYTKPLRISAEGEWILYYYSIDNLGNIEPYKSFKLKIDKTVPNVNAFLKGSKISLIVSDQHLANAKYNWNTPCIVEKKLIGKNFTNNQEIQAMPGTLYLCAEDMAKNFVVKEFSFAGKNQTTLTLSASPSWTVDYNTTTTVSCSANTNLTVELYRDGVLVASGVGSINETATLAAGTYSYVCNTTGNENWTSASVSNTL
ncbi:Ig-like domain-containing protein, partial [Candidatus Woesearchaeota archaeon]|nr:Ig-like domain-containing protein [Candidatus Woesearchaeota archaeon]